jgi:hypothetical protein
VATSPDRRGVTLAFLGAIGWAFGGHVLFILIERLRGRPISRGAFERASVVGIALILVLFVIGLQNDLNGIIGTSSNP